MKKQVKMILRCSLIVGSLLFTGCSAKEESKEAEKKVIKAATTDNDMEEMLLTTKDALKEAGYDLEIEMFSGDYVAPNIATDKGEIDVNFFQHVPYLDEFNKNQSTHLAAPGESIFYSNMGLFSDKINSLDEIKDGMSIAISSDATNRTRALKFMESMGLIKLEEGLNVYTKIDIKENPHNLDIVEMDVAMIPKSIPDMDMVIIYPYDVEIAGYDLKAIEMDPADIGSYYGIVLVVQEDNQNAEWLQIMQKTMQGEETKKVVEKYYGDTGVHISDY